MSATVRLKNGQTLQVEASEIDVTPATEPDEAWSFTDKKGHVHTWASATWTNRGTPGDVDSWDSSSYCSLCGEQIHPGMRAIDGRRYIYGPTLYMLDGEPITREQAEALIG